MKKRRFEILLLIFLLGGLISCDNDSPDDIIRKVEKEYEREYGSDLIMHRERERYKGMSIYRFTGWTVEDDRKYTMINSDEWMVIFCADNKHQVIKDTGYQPMDSIAKMYDIRCLSGK